MTGAVGAAGGTLAAPGFGTVGLGLSGAEIGAGIGATAGAVLGGDIGDKVGDAVDNVIDHILFMSKGGKRNISNEYSREARNHPDPCGWLGEQYEAARKAGDNVEAQKIVQAQKGLGCRNKSKRCR